VINCLIAVLLFITTYHYLSLLVSFTFLLKISAKLQKKSEVMQLHF